MSLSWGNSLVALEKLNNQTVERTEKALERVVDKTGRKLKRRSEVRTPVDTGKGRGSWAAATSKNGAKRRVKVFNTARTPKGQYYLSWVENGTIKIRPRKFFKKAQIEAEKFKQDQLKKEFAKIQRMYNRGRLNIARRSL